MAGSVSNKATYRYSINLGAGGGVGPLPVTAISNYTVPAGKKLVACVLAESVDRPGDNEDFTSFQFNGVEMNRRANIRFGTGSYAHNHACIFDLDLPAGATGDLVYTWDVVYTAGGRNGATGLAIDLYVVNDVALQAPEASNTSSSTSSPIDTSITTITSDAFIIDTFSCGNTGTGGVTQAGQVEQTFYNDDAVPDPSGYIFGVSTKEATTPGATLLGWSASNPNRMAHALVAYETTAPGPITGSGALISQAAQLSGTGQKTKQATGALSAQASALSGVGTKVKIGAGALIAASAVLNGAGEKLKQATGALVSQPAVLQGIGATAGTAVGTGNLIAQPATLSGAGSKTKRATGVMLAQSASLSGQGSLRWIGTGNLISQSAVLQGTGDIVGVITGSGNLVSSSATLQGTGKFVRSGIGTLVAQPATLSGSGAIMGQVAGSGNLIAQSSQLQGQGKLGHSGVGNLIAQPATLTGFGLIPQETLLVDVSLVAVGPTIPLSVSKPELELKLESVEEG